MGLHETSKTGCMLHLHCERTIAHGVEEAGYKQKETNTAVVGCSYIYAIRHRAWFLVPIVPIVPRAVGCAVLRNEDLHQFLL
jgi:hypothetical protein